MISNCTARKSSYVNTNNTSDTNTNVDPVTATTAPGIKLPENIYRIPLEEIIEMVPLTPLESDCNSTDACNYDTVTDSTDIQHTPPLLNDICSFNINNICYHINIVTLAKVYRIIVRGKKVAQYWVKTLNKLLIMKYSNNNMNSPNMGVIHPLRDNITQRNTMCSIPHGWYKYTNISNTATILHMEYINSKSVSNSRSIGNSIINTYAGVSTGSNSSSSSSGIGGSISSGGFYMPLDSTIKDTNSSNQRVILNNRSSYTGMNYTSPLIIRQCIAHDKAVHLHSTSSSSLSSSGNKKQHNVGSNIPSSFVNIPLSAEGSIKPRKKFRYENCNLCEYTSLLLQLLFNIISQLQSISSNTNMNNTLIS